MNYFQSKGNITGLLPRWVLLLIGGGMIVFQLITHPVLLTLVLAPLGIVVFFVIDFFAPRLIPWFSQRKQNAALKFERENPK